MGLLSRLKSRFALGPEESVQQGTERHPPATPRPLANPRSEHHTAPRFRTPAVLGLPVGADPVVLPGSTPVQIVGESYYLEAIRHAQQGQHLRDPMAVLLADVANPHDANAVAVYLNGRHAGYLSREVAAVVRPALDRFAAVNGGRPVGCPAEIREHDVGPQVVLYLDVHKLGLRPDDVEELSPVAKLLLRQMRRLDGTRVSFSGYSPSARQLLKAADSYAARVEQMNRGHKRLADEYRRAAEELTRAEDPLASRAWRSFARTVRYQQGRSAEAIEGLVGAVYSDRGSRLAWEDLLDYAAFLGCVPVLLDIFRQAPEGIRPHLVPTFLSISRGFDRYGHVPTNEHARLRQGLLYVAHQIGDNQTFSTIAGKYGLEAEKSGDLDAAVGYWKRATDAGYISDLAADRYSIWLVKHHQFEEAHRVLTQALAIPSPRDPVRDRIEKRLARCAKTMTSGNNNIASREQ